MLNKKISIVMNINHFKYMFILTYYYIDVVWLFQNDNEIIQIR